MLPRIYIFGHYIYSWGLFLLLALIVTVVAAVLLKPKDFPLKRLQIFWVAVLFFVSGFIGAKLLNIILHASRYQGRSVETVITYSGTAYLGAPLIGFLALWIFCRNMNVRFLTMADYAAPILMLERIFGRVGCTLHGCCYGIKSNLPWAHPFHVVHSGARHPTQVYALVCALAIFLSGRYLYKKIGHIEGVTFFYVILCYSFLRFINEFLRAEGPFIFGPIKLSHIVLFPMAVLSAIAIFNITKTLEIKDDVILYLKQAFLRLFIYLISAGSIALTALSFMPK